MRFLIAVPALLLGSLLGGLATSQPAPQSLTAPAASAHAVSMRSLEARAAADAALAVIDRALQTGVWTDDDALAFGVQLTKVSDPTCSA